VLQAYAKRRTSKAIRARVQTAREFTRVIGATGKCNGYGMLLQDAARRPAVLDVSNAWKTRHGEQERVSGKRDMEVMHGNRLRRYVESNEDHAA